MAIMEFDVTLKTNRRTKKWKKQQDKFLEIVERDTRQYVPAGTLALTKSAEIDYDKQTITYNKPYARYMYYGVLVTDENNRVWVRRGEKKPIVHPNRPLNYRKDIHPNATPFWFEISKFRQIRKWMRELRKG